MNNDFIIPPTPRAPREYDPEWVERTLRSIIDVLNTIRSNGPVRAHTLHVSDLPKNGNQLKGGQVYNDGGTLKVVQTNIGYAPTLVGTSALGTVTVVTT